MGRKHDLNGRSFGRLTVVRECVGPKPGPHWECVCECGNTVVSRAYTLEKGTKKSCGCLRLEAMANFREERTKNAMTKEERLEKRKIWNRRYKDRHPEKCKEISRQDNKKRKAERKKWVEENKERYQLAKRNWYEGNKEVVSEKARQFARDNPAWKAAHCAKRRSKKKNAIPKWFERDKVDMLYEKAREYGFFVDHIVPLQSKAVCGLHCWHNLQLLDPAINSEKHNSHWPDM